MAKQNIKTEVKLQKRTPGGFNAELKPEVGVDPEDPAQCLIINFEDGSMIYRCKVHDGFVRKRWAAENHFSKADHACDAKFLAGHFKSTVGLKREEALWTSKDG